MRRVTASEARRDWFRLLDDIAQGEIVMIERAGKRIVLRAEGSSIRQRDIPDYSDVIHVPNLDGLEQWTWEWHPDEGLRIVERSA